MFVRRSLIVWLVTSVLLVVAVCGLAALAARRNRYDIHSHQFQQRELLTTGPGSTSRFRNLSFQPEAAKLSKRLGQRFIGSESDVSVLIGEVTTGETRIPLRVVRKQDERGESVDFDQLVEVLERHLT